MDDIALRKVVIIATTVCLPLVFVFLALSVYVAGPEYQSGFYVFTGLTIFMWAVVCLFCIGVRIAEHYEDFRREVELLEEERPDYERWHD